MAGYGSPVSLVSVGDKQRGWYPPCSVALRIKWACVGTVPHHIVITERAVPFSYARGCGAGLGGPDATMEGSDSVPVWRDLCGFPGEGNLLQINPRPQPQRLTGQLSVTRSTSLDLGTRSYQKHVTSLTVARSVKVSYRGLTGAKRGQEWAAFCAREGEGASKGPETAMGQG